MKYKDKVVIIELPFPDFITTLCIIKTISPENNSSFVVNLEFRDNPEKWNACKCLRQAMLCPPKILTVFYFIKDFA